MWFGATPPKPAHADRGGTATGRPVLWFTRLSGAGKSTMALAERRAELTRYYTLSPGLASMPHLEAFLAGEPRLGMPILVGLNSAMMGWGRRASWRWAARYAAVRGLPCYSLEDGFLRSVGFGRTCPPLALVADDLGIHFDATGPSRLERFVLDAQGDAGRAARGRAVVEAWRAGRLSKYNHSPDWPASEPLSAGFVLVVDQTRGDDSIRYGLAGEESFKHMLEAAIDENPGREILLKVHPEVFAGRKRGHFEAMSAGQRGRVRVLGRDVHPPSLLEQAGSVYAVTSQMGFEGLLWGCRVRTFGMPFYAGWGLTGDDLPAPSRRQAVDLVALAHAALVDYPRYVDPESGRRCEVERVMDYLAGKRRLAGQLPSFPRRRESGSSS